MATLASPIAFARAQAQTDSNGLTDANAIIYANEVLLDFRRRLVTKGVDAAQVQEAYRDASVPTSGNGSTFLYPTNPAILFLKSIDVNYTDTNPQNYKQASQMDASNIPQGESFMWLRQNADRSAPQFDDRGDWYELFPAFRTGDNLTAAIRLIYFQMPTEYTSTSDTVSYPESLDYRILGWRIAADYYYSLNKFQEGDLFNNKYDERVTQLISTLSRGAQQPIQATPIQVSGWEF